MDRRHFLAATAAAALAPGLARAQARTSEDAKLRALFDQMFEEILDNSPEAVTRLGLHKGRRLEQKSMLDPQSVAHLAAEKARNVRNLQSLRRIDRTKLSAGEAPHYDAVMFTTVANTEADARYAYGNGGAGQPYVLSQLTGAYQDIPDFLGTQHTIETKADADAYLSRLEAFAGVMDEETERARRDVGLGVIPPDFVLERALAQMGNLKVDPASSPLVTSVATRAQEKGVPGDYAGEAARIY